MGLYKHYSKNGQLYFTINDSTCKKHFSGCRIHTSRKCNLHSKIRSYAVSDLLFRFVLHVLSHSYSNSQTNNVLLRIEKNIDKSQQVLLRVCVHERLN